jgi:transposase InsO family protein
MKIQHPKMSAQTIIDTLAGENKLPANAVSPASVYRLFQQQIPKRLANKTGKEQKRFVHRYPNDCWQADTMHGPYIKDNGIGKARKTYLVAFIDDASRLITGAEFFYAETTAHIKTVLRHAVMTYGVPAKLYVDNGRPYRAEDIRIACASMHTALIHTSPYYPQAKGKIERFFRTVRSRFLAGLRTVNSLHDLNVAFDAWLQNEYNRHEHGALDKQTPLTVFLHRVEGRLRRLPKHIDPAELFCRKEQRQVAHNGTFRINNRLYETEEHLIGRKIYILYDKDDPTHAVKIFDGPCYVHTAMPLDYFGNAQSKRKPLD